MSNEFESAINFMKLYSLLNCTVCVCVWNILQGETLLYCMTFHITMASFLKDSAQKVLNTKTNVPLSKKQVVMEMVCLLDIGAECWCDGYKTTLMIIDLGF